MLEVTPSTYHAAAVTAGLRSALGRRGSEERDARVRKDNFGVYGIDKVCRQLNREGSPSVLTGLPGACASCTWPVPFDASTGAPRCRAMSVGGRVTSSTGTSPHPRPTGSGSPISPTSTAGPGSSTVAFVVDVVVALCGDVQLMPGFGKEPQYRPSTSTNQESPSA